MSDSSYTRSLPEASITTLLRTTRYALEMFDARSRNRILYLGRGDVFFEEHYPVRFVGLDVGLGRVRRAHR